MKIIEVMNLISRYKLFFAEQEKTKEVTVLDGVTLSINKGDFVGISGHNGSGKSTLARQLTALLKPAGGIVCIKGMDTSDDRFKYEIRKTAGIVFQNPDNQLIGATVEEDVAFGMENLGIPEAEMDRRIGEVLSNLGMSAYRMSSPDDLSGGQKQKIAISGILAMQPDCIIFDEPTAMLDPRGRQEVMDAVRFLNREKGITVIYITHHTEEVKDADCIYLMKQGKVMLSGRPEEIWARPDILAECGAALPFVQDMIWRLHRSGLEDFSNPDLKMTEEELVEFIAERVKTLSAHREEKKPLRGNNTSTEIGSRTEIDNQEEISDREKNEGRIEINDITEMSDRKDIGNKAEDRVVSEDRSQIVLDHISYSYQQGAGRGNRSTKEERPKYIYAVKDISLSIGKGEYIAVIGQTGSGKSTLLSILNGLIFATYGKYIFKGKEIRKKDPYIKELRRKVGHCFQYPDHQLFEETVLKDIAFAPRNMGCDKEESEAMARKAMDLVGLPASMENLSPFTLSGGEKRRVAIAGILAMEPEYLLLDEPAAGLDKDGKENLFALLRKLSEEKKITIILVSHDMDEVAANASRILLMDKGECVADGPPSEIFMDLDLLREAGLAQPECIRFYTRLCERIGLDSRTLLMNPGYLYTTLCECRAINDGSLPEKTLPLDREDPFQNDRHTDTFRLPKNSVPLNREELSDIIVNLMR